VKRTLLDSFTAAGASELVAWYPNWIGDAVMALPALEALRRSLPEGATLAVLAKPWTADIASLSGLPGRIVENRAVGGHRGLAGRARLVASLRRDAIGGGVLFPNSIGSALALFLAGIPLRGGYASEGRGPLLTHSVPPTPDNWPRGHLVEYYLEMVRSLGFDAPVDAVPRLKTTPVDAETARVAFAPGAAFGPAKMWPGKRWAELGRRLAARGLRVDLLGASSEAAVCAALAADIGGAARDLSGRTTLREAAGILAGARLAVTNDSGLMHLAAAVGTPVTAIFGSTDPTATGPRGKRLRIVRGEAPCAPCYRRSCNRGYVCFDPVGVDQVERACLELLGEAG
jgi:heptosyltransferase-2